MRVLLDADGVVVDFNRGWKKIASQRIGRHIDHRQRTWKHFMEGVDLNAEIERCMSEPDVWRDAKPYPGVISSLKALSDMAIQFHVVTSIRREFEYERRMWMERHGVPFRSLNVSQSAADKVIIAKALKLTVAIDDNQENARMLAAAGLHTFLLARWWNEPEQGLERVTWRQLPDRLIQLQECQ